MVAQAAVGEHVTSEPPTVPSLAISPRARDSTSLIFSVFLILAILPTGAQSASQAVHFVQRAPRLPCFDPHDMTAPEALGFSIFPCMEEKPEAWKASAGHRSASLADPRQDIAPALPEISTPPLGPCHSCNLPGAVHNDLARPPAGTSQEPSPFSVPVCEISVQLAPSSVHRHHSHSGSRSQQGRLAPWGKKALTQVLGHQPATGTQAGQVCNSACSSLAPLPTPAAAQAAVPAGRTGLGSRTRLEGLVEPIRICTAQPSAAYSSTASQSCRGNSQRHDPSYNTPSPERKRLPCGVTSPVLRNCAFIFVPSCSTSVFLLPQEKPRSRSYLCMDAGLQFVANDLGKAKASPLQEANLEPEPKLQESSFFPQTELGGRTRCSQLVRFALCSPSRWFYDSSEIALDSLLTGLCLQPSWRLCSTSLRFIFEYTEY
ncbi:PREDICTED: uncharacterized protein LOC102021530 [Chinchilla lanigera]|uniref:uncharacterized protein LOC102021530 n=1 Tax=Chinchilla lanigera TaxID=34839 RepID=UPI000697DB0B|nr:PREDICTED: uncharacterized protein LOC102021530 [Chinchilla lanigera]